MTALFTALSFLLLALDRFGVATGALLQGIVFIATAVLWLAHESGVVLPTWRRGRD